MQVQPRSVHGRGEEVVEIRFEPANAAGLYRGPNPPPPPPPPPACGKAYNQSACDAVPATKGGAKGCAWCTSDDKVHALCFDALHEPDSSWSCDR